LYKISLIRRHGRIIKTPLGEAEATPLKKSHGGFGKDEKNRGERGGIAIPSQKDHEFFEFFEKLLLTVMIICGLE